MCCIYWFHVYIKLKTGVNMCCIYWFHVYIKLKTGVDTYQT